MNLLPVSSCRTATPLPNRVWLGHNRHRFGIAPRALGRPRARARGFRSLRRRHLAGFEQLLEPLQILFDRSLRVVSEHPRHRRFFEVNRPFLAEVAPLENCLTEDPIQVMFSGGCVEMRTLFERLQQRTDGFSVALTEYVHRDFSLVDIVTAGCSKGSALRAWAGERGFVRDEVMAMGDNLNDLQMLEFAGTAVLMENALPELKARGWAITGSNNDGGVAQAIDRYVLEGSGPRVQSSTRGLNLTERRPI